MPKMSSSTKRTSLSAVEQYELNQWLEQNHITSNNLRRSFTDVLPLARLLSKYYPELIDLNYYPPRNSVQNKLCNWESFNKRVLGRLGVHLTRDQMVRVARSVPGSVDLLLYSIMRVQIAEERKAREANDSTEDDDENAAQPQDDNKNNNNKDDDDETEEAKGAAGTNVSMPKTLKQAKAELKKQSNSIVAARSATVSRGVGVAVARTRGSIMQGQGRNKKLVAAVSEGLGTQRQQRGELLIDLPHQQQQQRMVLYSIYMQAVHQLQRKNAKIARFNQLSAHLENMLQLKCDRIDELQQQVATTLKRLKPIKTERSRNHNNKKKKKQQQQRRSPPLAIKS